MKNSMQLLDRAESDVRFVVQIEADVGVSMCTTNQTEGGLWSTNVLCRKEKQLLVTKKLTVRITNVFE